VLGFGGAQYSSESYSHFLCYVQNFLNAETRIRGSHIHVCADPIVRYSVSFQSEPVLSLRTHTALSLERIRLIMARSGRSEATNFLRRKMKFPRQSK